MKQHAAALVVVVVCALAATSCASAEDIADSSSSTAGSSHPTPPVEPTGGVTPSPSPATPSVSTVEPPTVPTDAPTSEPPANAPRPRAGECHNASRAAFHGSPDTSPAISCSRVHTAETFAVFDLGVHPTHAAMKLAARSCQAPFEEYFGAPSTVSTIGYALLLSSTGDVQWARCEAIELANYNADGGLQRTGSLRRALAGTVPDEFRGCTARWPKPDQPVHFTSCRAPHQAELIPVSLSLGGPEARFPGRSTAESRSKQFCLDNFQEWVPEAVNYYYYFPTRASWSAGSHQTTCWAIDVTGDGLPPI